MDKLNRLNVWCILITLFVAGCGKEKAPAVKEYQPSACSRPVSKELAQNVPIKEKYDSIDLLDDDAFAEFAFLDDEALPPEAPEKRDHDIITENLALVAENDNDDDLDLDLDLDLAPELGDGNTDPAFAFKSVMFDFNKNSIRADQKTVVAQDVGIAQQAVDQGKKVVIEGHSCQIGSAAYNVALSQRRAEAVKTELVKNGIAPENVKTVGYGYERPLVWSDAGDRTQLLKELAPNRRAEVLVN